MSHDVFISYSTHDAATANAVCAVLEGAGIRCWIAPRDVPVGRGWKESIVEAIGASRAVVLLLSSAANRSSQVTQEVSIAFDAEPRIPVLPVRVEDVRPTGGLLYCIGSSHWLDALTPDVEAHGRRLARELRARGYVEVPNEGVVDPPPAPAWAATDAAVPAAPVPAAPEPVPVPSLTPVPAAAAVARTGPAALHTSRPRVLLTAFAALAFTAVILGVLVARRPGSGARPSGADPVSASVSAPPPPPGPSVPPAVQPAPVPEVARAESIRAATPTLPRPGAVDSASPAPAEAVARGRRPMDSAAVAGRRPTQPKRPALDARNRGAAPAPGPSAGDCARLLERVSLGELSAQESARLARGCRGSPR